VFLYSALLAVPNELVEAANIDGAGGWTTFWKIKFPLIAPQFGLIAILTYIWTFNGFDLVFALNGSAPGPNYSTDILGTYFYRTFFGSSGQLADLDLGSAVATVHLPYGVAGHRSLFLADPAPPEILFGLGAEMSGGRCW